MTDHYRNLRPGEPIGRDHPITSVQRNRAINDLVDPAARAALPSIPTQSTGGGGTSSNSQLVMVCEDLLGFAWDGLTASPGTVRCLPITIDGGTYTVDHEADWIDAYPREGVAVTLAKTGCGCGEEGSTPPSGLAITTFPNRVTSGTITIAGRGVANDSTVTVSISDGTTTKTAASVTVNGDGTWEADPIDPAAATALNDGVLKVTAQETTIDSVAQAAVSIGVVYFTETIGGGVYVPQQPSPPDMTDATDTGTSNTDNRTSDTTPDWYVELPAGSPGQDPTGPEPWLVIDGVVDFEGAFDAMASGSTTITQQTAGAAGRHTAQWLQVRNETPTQEVPGPISDVTYYTIDPNADETPVAPEDVPSGRTGTVTTIGGVAVLEDLGPCPIPLAQEIIDKLAE